MHQPKRDYIDSIFESIPTGVITTDLNGTVININAAAARLLGILVSEVKGISFLELFSRDSKTALKDGMKYVTNTGKPFRGQEQVVGKRDRATVIVPVIGLAKDKEGQKQGFVIVVEDLYQQRLIHEHLQRADKQAALGEMAVGIAHELRNPLGTIHGYASLLLTEMADDDGRGRYLQVIKSEVERLSKLTESLLDYSRPTGGDFTDLDINQVLEKTLLLFQMETSIHEVAVLKLFDNSVPLIVGDEQRLQQAFLNLLFNSLQAICSSEGEIHVETGYESEGDWVTVSIKDNGGGIAEDISDKVFNPFFTTKDTGTGLGLAITHRIISDHSGLIKVSSELNKGTVFVLKFPSKERMVLLG
ncbi:ATP-binding protein [Metallumcola ferriviriculae]|uniref:histidine kinase n=1 Tax=Metallumcola ferriviriculae TaxID=3039180 RepID=A0AAU0UNW7_9FIRM|nr:ATP-binding protein [Desulfitibacteraceae bacterium MK1]